MSPQPPLKAARGSFTRDRFYHLLEPDPPRRRIPGTTFLFVPVCNTPTADLPRMFQVVVEIASTSGVPRAVSVASNGGAEYYRGDYERG